jgi:flagellar L-ring protein precursor FlgH
MLSRKSLAKAAICFIALTVSGCSTYVQNRTSERFIPHYADIAAYTSPNSSTGSIYKASAKTGLFTTDQRARAIGDIVTVSFTESFSATKSQSASSSKSDEMGFTFPFGLSDHLNGSLSSQSEMKFAGSGAAAQSNTLSGLLSATVVRVYDNGNMEIVGQKRLTLNNGNEHVRLRGVIRPEDISANNIVLSSQIVDAEITYTGAGDIHDTAKMGWLARGIRAVSPF